MPDSGFALGNFQNEAAVKLPLRSSSTRAAISKIEEVVVSALPAQVQGLG
jgi:hypothetical protein